MYKTLILSPPGDNIGTLFNSCKHRSPQIFQDAMALRETVFCHEQGCSLINELDEDDGRSWHWVFYDSEEDQPIGVVRLVPPPHPPHPNGPVNEDVESYIKLTRIAVAKAFRGRNLGRVLTQEALQWAAKHSKEIGHAWRGLVLIHAQVIVEKFYQQLGFKTDQNLGQWDEEGIPHVGMWKRISIENII